jgi:putative hydrolase of the HAD superfamily
MAREAIRAVLLDALGTLVRMDAPGPHLRSELRAAGLDVSEEQAAAAFRAEISYYLDHHLEGRDAAALDDLRDRCAAVLSEALPPHHLPRARVREAMLAAIRFQPFPDAAPALAALRRRGLRLVVVSNWDCSLPGVLEDAGLAGLVDAVVASAVVGADKPAPAVFEAALAAAGSAAREALFVGDSVERDLEGARAAGITAVLIRRESPGETGGRDEPAPPPGATVVRELGELAALF